MYQGILSVGEASQFLEITTQRIRQLIKAKRLPAVQFSGRWMIKIEDLKAFKPRGPGRPPKEVKVLNKLKEFLEKDEK